MSYITRVKNWTAEKLYAADLNTEINNIISGTSDGSKDMAIAKLGVGTTTLTYLCNLTTTSLARALSISQTYATGSVYGAYVSTSGASTNNYGVYSSTTGATNNYAIYGTVVGSGTQNYAGIFLASGAVTAAAALFAQNSSSGATEYAVIGQCSGASAGTNMALYGSAANSVGLNYDLYCGGADDTSYAKLPYWTAAPAGAVANGTVAIVRTGGNSYIYARTAGAWVKVQVS